MPPVALDRALGDANGLGHFLDGETAEEAQRDDPRLALVKLRQLVEGGIEAQQVLRAQRLGQGWFATGTQGYAPPTKAPLGRPALPGVVDQQPAHDLGTDGEEMGSAREACASLIHEPQVGFVNQCGGLERVADWLPRHEATGQSPELIVDKWKELFCGGPDGLRAGLELRDDLGDPVPRIGWHVRRPDGFHSGTAHDSEVHGEPASFFELHPPASSRYEGLRGLTAGFRGVLRVTCRGRAEGSAPIEVRAGREETMQRQVRVIVLIAVAALVAAPAAAAESGWTVRIYGAWAKPNVDLPVVDSDIPVDVSGNGALGAGAGLEYRFRPWVGLGVDALHARPDIVLEADLPGGRRLVSDGFGFTPFSLGPVFHLTPGRAVDLTVTAMVGFAVYGDLLFAVDGEELRLQGGSDLGWGLGAAIDIHPGASHWAIHAGVRRYESDPEFTNRDNRAVGSAAINPVVVTVGVGYRF